VFGFIGIDVPSQMSIHGITICVTCDLPAHALVQNMVQFNGIYGCTFCEQPGKTVTTAQGGNVHVYPYNHEDPGDLAGHIKAVKVLQLRLLMINQ